MRIALVTDAYSPQVNGVTTVVRRQVGVLRRAGCPVSVVAPTYPVKPSDQDVPTLRIPSVSFPPYPAIRLALPAPRRVARFLDAQQPDVVHVVTEGPLGYIGRRYALQRRLPLVTSYHTHFPRYCTDYGVPALTPVVWRWIRRFHRPAALIQTPGHEAWAALRAQGLDQAVVWGHGVDTELFHPGRRRESWRHTMGVARDEVLIIHVGRLAPEKNLGVLAKAWVQVRESLGVRVRFIVAGEGPEERRLAAMLPWARHLGFLDRERLADLYANADLCVLPSRTETCGLVALEALASGIPVVAADAGGLRESVAHRVNGLLAAPDQPEAFAAAIVELAMGHPFRKMMAEGARRTALTRDAAREDQDLLTLYGVLLGRQTPERRCPAA